MGIFLEDYDKRFSEQHVKETKIDDVRRRWFVIFDLELKTPNQWAEEIGIHHNTFRDFFCKGVSWPATVRKFQQALTRLEKKYNIEQK